MILPRFVFCGLLVFGWLAVTLTAAVAQGADLRVFLQEYAPAYVARGPSSGPSADAERAQRAFEDAQRLQPEFQSWTQPTVTDLAEKLVQSSTAPVLERAWGEFYLGHYSKAEDLALKAGDDAHRAEPRRQVDIAQSLHLAALAAAERGHTEEALKYIKVAIGETDSAKELLVWARVHASLAHLQWRNGSPAEQILTLKKIHAEFLRLVGPDHAYTLHHHNELAAALYDDKQDAAAARELRDILTVTQKNHGPDEARTVAVRKNLARVLEGQELFDEAEVHRRDVVESQRKSLGADHKATLRSREQLVQNLVEQRKFAEATTEAIGLLEQSQRVLGAEDLTTLICRSRLARCQFEQGEVAEAETQLRQLYDYELKTLGAEHRETLNTGHDLGACLIMSGKAEEAVKLLQTVIKQRIALLSENHRDVLETRTQLGRAYEATHKLAEAEIEYRAALNAFIKSVGASHPKTILLTNRINQMMETPEAKALIISNSLKNVEKLKAEHGAKDIRTLNARLGYAAALSEQKKYAEAEKEYRDVHVTLTRLQKEDTSQSLMVLREVANCLGNQNKLKEADVIYTQLLKKMRFIYTKPDPEVVRTMNMHGLCLLRLNRLDEARVMMENCIQSLNSFPDVNPDFLQRAQTIYREILRLQKDGGEFSAEDMMAREQGRSVAPQPAAAAAAPAPLQVPASAILPADALKQPNAPAIQQGDTSTINKPLPFN